MIEVFKVLVVIGWKVNIVFFGLENIDVKLIDCGVIVVDEYFCIDVENIWVIGDVKGGL